MSKKRLTLYTSLRKIIVSQEKVKPTGLKRASNRALDP